MFVYSVKSKYLKTLLLILFIVVTTVCLVFLAHDSKETAKINETTLRASNESERVTFISQYGWDVNENPVEVREIIIPEEFDDVYLKYNEIQLKQGFDLKQYAGMRVKRWTYAVKNYKGYENRNCIRANILVYDGNVIGGDICSTELRGFMHGFKMP